jgi:hypothetical protein
MFRAESLELLARSRRPRLTNGSANHRNGSRAALLREHNDTAPTEDPDDSMDPNNSGPRLSVTLKEPVGETYALPEPLEAEQTSGRHPDTGDQSGAPQSPPREAAQAAGTPARPDLLDPVVLRTMPPQVAAFMLYEPPRLPSWRPQETTGQRKEREFFEELGGWCG